MARDASKMTLWTGYFDSKLSRSNGRRVPREASIPSPTLDAIAWAARDAGITKMKREPESSHPSRPHAQEGRLILSTADAKRATRAESKEGVMQSIGLRLRRQFKESKEREGAAKASGPSKGDKQQRSQRKSFKGKSGASRKKKFGRK